MTWQERFKNQVICGDCLEVMKEMPDNSIDSCVTDPPYGLEFMGKEWDKPGKLWDKREGDPEKHKTGRTWAEEKSRPSGNKGYSGLTANPIYQAGLSFQQWTTQWASQLLRILKPGAYLLAFGGTRTEHRLACGIEDAGFIIRDRISWMYGSGFPKNKDVSKGFDKAEGVEREVVGSKLGQPGYSLAPDKQGNISYNKANDGSLSNSELECQITAPATPLAKQWAGWGTALKPSFEFIVLAQKPLDKNYCHNLEKWGCGAINIDGGRIEGPEPHHNYGRTSGEKSFVGKSDQPSVTPTQGRWPANLILECTCEKVIPGKAGELTDYNWGESNQGNPAHVVENIKSGQHYDGEKGAIHTDPDCPCRLLDEESERIGIHSAGKQKPPGGWDSAGGWGFMGEGQYGGARYGDSGGASRFFKYIPKADRAEKEAGLKGRLPCVKCGELNSETHLVIRAGAFGLVLSYLGFPIPIAWLVKVNCVRNDHPTVKPVELFRYLQMMFTPPKGLTIDPFAGSGSSCISAIREDFDFIAIDQDEGYCKIAEARITEEVKQLKLFP